MKLVRNLALKKIKKLWVWVCQLAVFYILIKGARSENQKELICATKSERQIIVKIPRQRTPNLITVNQEANSKLLKKKPDVKNLKLLPDYSSMKNPIKQLENSKDNHLASLSPTDKKKPSIKQASPKCKSAKMRRKLAKSQKIEKQLKCDIKGFNLDLELLPMVQILPRGEMICCRSSSKEKKFSITLKKSTNKKKSKKWAFTAHKPDKMMECKQTQTDWSIKESFVSTTGSSLVFNEEQRTIEKNLLSIFNKE